MTRIKEFKLPDVGEGLTEAEIVTWQVAAATRSTLNQPIVEIETAKAVVELPSPYAGTVTELFHAEGETVEVGTPIIAIDTDPGAGDRRRPRRRPRRWPRSRSRRPRAPVEPGLIGGPAPGGRTAVLVGYGPQDRRPPTRRAAQGAPAPAAAAPAPAAAAGGRAGRRGRRPPAVAGRAGAGAGRRRRACWPSRRCASWPRTSASTWPR